jgi:hypothetical protein
VHVTVALVVVGSGDEREAMVERLGAFLGVALCFCEVFFVGNLVPRLLGCGGIGGCRIGV